MLRKMIFLTILLSLAVPMTIGADVPEESAKLSAAQIVDRNVVARGGLQAWRAVQTMSYSGKMDAGGKQNVQLPFVIEMKRPRKTRVEIEFANDKAVQVYDGASGWKLRPFLGRRDVEPFSTEEMKSASMESELDGPLVDYSTKGTQVSLLLSNQKLLERRPSCARSQDRRRYCGVSVTFPNLLARRLP